MQEHMAKVWKLQDKGSGKLSVFNIPDSLTDTNCRDLFSQFGPLKSLNLIKDITTSRLKGYGFFEYESSKNVDM